MTGGSNWKCTGECRYRQKPADGLTTYERVLQQNWTILEKDPLGFMVWQEEWRDVPVVQDDN